MEDVGVDERKARKHGRFELAKWPKGRTGRSHTDVVTVSFLPLRRIEKVVRVAAPDDLGSPKVPLGPCIRRRQVAPSVEAPVHQIVGGKYLEPELRSGAIKVIPSVFFQHERVCNPDAEGVLKCGNSSKRRGG